jgi:hypothetical protein
LIPPSKTKIVQFENKIKQLEKTIEITQKNIKNNKTKVLDPNKCTIHLVKLGIDENEYEHEHDDYSKSHDVT